MTAFPFKAAKPKTGFQGQKPSMSFEMPAPPPVEEKPPPEVSFDQEEPEVIDQAAEVEEEMAKKPKNGRRTKRTPIVTPHKESGVATFTFAEVVSILGEDVPYVKVVARITPIIEVLEEDERKKVVEILMRLYG